MTKQEIIQDEILFQRACGLWVERNIGQCVSSLMYDVGRNLEECSRIFDFDYDEALGWFVQDDWEEPVNYFIDSADLDDLEAIADMVGEWAEILDEVGVKSDFYEDKVAVKATPQEIKQIRSKVQSLISGDEYREIADTFNLDPYQIEIYEHWNCSRDMWDMLKSHGEVVFEFENLLVWGRTTSGQSIGIDYVIRKAIKEFDDDHWVWREG